MKGAFHLMFDYEPKPNQGEAPKMLDITITEARELTNQHSDHETFMKAIRVDVREAVGNIVSGPID